MTIIMAAMLGIGLVSCNSDDDETPSNLLVGTWRFEYMEGGNSKYDEMTFNKDFSVIYVEYNAKTRKQTRFLDGTYKVFDNRITITWSNGYTDLLTIIDGEKLRLDTDDDGIFYKIKK